MLEVKRMINLFKASLYKLFKEKTFFITLIIGTVLAIIIPVLMHAILETAGGEFMLMSSVSIGSNFGLTVPINLTVLTVAEFTTGTLRNKIIAGYRKSRIYISLLFSGLIFTLILMVFYISLNVLMGTILGGFDINKIGGADFIWPYLAMTLCCYIFVTTLSIFVATSIRNIGASIPIMVVALVFLSLVPTILMLSNNDTAKQVLQWLDPVYCINMYGSTDALMPGMMQPIDDVIAPGIASPLIYSAIFIVLGIVEFSRRDVK